MQGMQRYLRCTESIDCETKSIKEKAQALTRGLKTDKEKAITLFYFVRVEIKFNPYAPADRLEYNKASATLKRGQGFCFQKAVLLVALARAVGIPARLGFAEIRNHIMSEEFTKRMFGSNVLVYHGYAELYIDGKWVVATPAYDMRMCQESGFIPVDFDGVNDARFPRYTRDGKLHIEYLKYHGSYDDFPWEEILKARDEFVASLGIDVAEFMTKWRTEPPQ